MTNTTPRGFVRSLFLGQIETAAFFPFPRPDAETQEMTEAVTDMVRDWATEAIDAAAIDEQKTIPDSVIDGMKELGLFGLTIPEEFGGGGCGQITYCAAMEEVAYRCASTVTVLGGHLGIGMKGLLLYGTDEQKAKWLPALASGERLAAFALTEASAGSDAGALRTSADPQPDGTWRLNGRKIWITNGGIANYFTAFARTPDPERPDAPLMERPISAFIVPGEVAGLSIGAQEDKMGLRGSSTTEVGFEDVVLPADALLGPQGEGFKVALNTLNTGRHGLSACCIGQARLARELAVAHAVEREQFGRPIAGFGMVRDFLAGMDADLHAMRVATRFTASQVDAGRDTMLESACCKMYATERLWQICNDALQVTGGTGFMREYPYERILRDARINLIFEGTNQVLRMLVATQGLRGLRGEARTADGPRFEATLPALEEEGARFERFVQQFSAACADVAERHGKALREAQYDQRRLSDMTIALFMMGVVLSEACSREVAPDDAELPVIRLSLRRLARDFERAHSEHESPSDDLTDAVARGMTGL